MDDPSLGSLSACRVWVAEDEGIVGHDGFLCRVLCGCEQHGTGQLATLSDARPSRG